MTQTPYNPLRRPEKYVTTEDMWTTLAKHSPVPLQTPKGSESPKEKRRVLVWEKPVKTGELAGYVLSADGGFSVDKTPVNGVAMYTAWARRQPPHESINLGVRTTLKEAQHLCEIAPT